MNDIGATILRIAFTHRLVVATVVLALATALIYGQVSAFDYVYLDDVDYVFAAPIRDGLSLEGLKWAFTESYMSNWHPLTWISHMLDTSLFGTAPGPAHLVNVLIHCFNGLLLLQIGLRLGLTLAGSCLATMLFLIHPLHVESVAWIAERKDVLSTFFYFGALSVYVGYTQTPSSSRYFAVLTLFALALMAKPMAVTLPLACLLLDYWPGLNTQHSRVAERLPSIKSVPLIIQLGIEKLPMFTLALASGLVTLLAQSTAMATLDAVPFGFRIMNAMIAYTSYLHDLVLPVNLAPFYPLKAIDFWREFLPATLTLLAMTGALIHFSRRSPPLLIGWLWFLITLLPVIGLIQVGSQSHADRYMYLPSAGLLLALGALLRSESVQAQARLLCLTLIPVLCCYSFLAWVQVGYWRNPPMLFGRVLDVSGHNYPAHVNLAAYYLGQRNFSSAKHHSTLAMQLSPDSPAPHRILGQMYLARKDPETAAREFRKALSLDPQDHRSRKGLEQCMLVLDGVDAIGNTIE